MDRVLDSVSSIIVSLACDQGFIDPQCVDGTNACDTTRILKNRDVTFNALQKQSVAYVTSLSWSLLSDRCRASEEGDGQGGQTGDTRREPLVILARDVLSSYSEGDIVGKGHDRVSQYILGLVVMKSIRVVCTENWMKGAVLVGQVRHALIQRVCPLISSVHEDTCVERDMKYWMDLVMVVVETVDVCDCWDILVDVIMPTIDSIGDGAMPSRTFSSRHVIHVYIASAAIQRILSVEDNVVGGSGTRSMFLHWMYDDVFTRIMEYLRSQIGSLEHPLVMKLLHDIIQSTALKDSPGGDASCMLGRVWDVCCNALEPMDALGLLVQYIDAMIATNVCGVNNKHLWSALEWGLLNPSSLQKKRGMYVLERVIDSMPNKMARQWKRFVQLFTALDDTSLHLFKAHWDEISLLHPEGSSENDERLPFFWIEIIWRMAVTHQQTTAQKMALVSFLNRVWSFEDLKQLSSVFFDETLIPAFGQGTVYSGIYAEEINEGMATFFKCLADSRTSDDSFCELLIPFLKGLCKSQQQHALIFCARVLEIFCESRGCSFQASGLVLDLISDASKAQHIFGANYVAILVHRSLMKICILCLAVHDSSDVDRVLSWIGAIPNGLICKGGTLHDLGVSVFGTLLSKSTLDMHEILKYALSTGEGSFDTKLGSQISSLVKASMLMCETNPDILNELTLYIRSDIKKDSDMLSDQDYWFLSSLIENFIPLEGKQLHLSSYNEYVISKCQEFGCVTLPLVAQNALESIKSLSRSTIERICAFVLAKIGSIDPTGADLMNIECLLPPDIPQFRERLAMQIQTINQITQATCLAARDGHVEYSFNTVYEHLLQILSALVERYRDIISYSPHEILTTIGDIGTTTHLTISKQCLFEIRILVMRLLSSIGDSFTTLYTNASVPLSHPFVSVAEEMLALSVQSLQETRPILEVASGEKTMQTKGEIGTKKAKRQNSAASAEDWLSLCSWRSVASCLSSLKGCSMAFSPSLVSSIIVYGMHYFDNATDGDPVIIPIVHSFRQLIPIILKDWNAYGEIMIKDLTNGAVDEPMDHIFKSICSSLIHLVRGQTRRRLGLSAAILTTVLHPVFFSEQALKDPKICAMHAEGGAIHESLRKLVSVGQSYNRLLVQISCHLGFLLLEQPCLGKQYSLLIQELCLSGFGTEASLRSLRDEVLDRTTASEVAGIMTSVPPDVAAAYAQAECAPRVGIICLLYEWIQKGLEGDQSSMEACRLIWSTLYSSSRNDKDLSQSVYTHGGIVHKRKIRLWQALAILSPCIPSDEIETQFKSILEDLDSPNAVTVKQYQEIVGATLVIRMPTLLERYIFSRISDYSSQRREANPCLFSIITVVITHFDQKDVARQAANQGAMALFPSNMSRSVWKKMLIDSIEHLLPWTGAFPHANRTFAQIVVWSLLNSYPEITETRPFLKRIASFLDSNRDMKRLHVRIGISGKTLERFDVFETLKPTSILCGPRNSLIRKASKQQTCENAPLPMVQEMLDYLSEQREDTRHKVSHVMKQAQDASFSSGPLSTFISSTKNTDECDTVWQRKITPKDQLQSALQLPWKRALGTLALRDNQNADTITKIDSFEKLLQLPFQEENSNRQEIVVVASFIDKVPNLAGLTRTCEIFRAKKLILGDISIKDDPDFASISVSANNWCPLEEVKPEYISSWLENMRRVGYRLVGLEQTDSSISLPEYTFVSKTVLVLGAEKEGIPANILSILDDTIEIPQLGVIRSLNVHVSAAITLYHYTCMNPR